MQNSAKKWKGAIVGFGFISGKGHVPAYLERQDVEIVAVADICAARRVLVREFLPEARVYNSYKELLAKENEIDFIDISTPPCDHAEIAIAALELGIHVLCEKPLATNTEEAKKILLSAQKQKRVVYPCHNYKHAPVVKVIKSAIDSGRIGMVRSLTLQTFRYTHAKGAPEWRTDWRRELRYSGGGIAMDHGSHTFYLTFSWLGCLPTHVSAAIACLDSRWDTEDNLHCILKFPNGMASSFLSWTAGARKMIYTVEGTHGAIFVDNDEVQLVVKENTVEKFSIRSDWMDASHTAWFNSMFDDFLSCIDRKDFVNAELKEAYLCVDIIEKCYVSNRESSQMIPIHSGFQFLKEESRSFAAVNHPMN